METRRVARILLGALFGAVFGAFAVSLCLLIDHPTPPTTQHVTSFPAPQHTPSSPASQSVIDETPIGYKEVVDGGYNGYTHTIKVPVYKPGTCHHESHGTYPAIGTLVCT